MKKYYFYPEIKAEKGRKGAESAVGKELDTADRKADGENTA